MLFHGELSGLARRGYLPDRRGSRLFSGLPETPYLPPRLTGPRALFLDEEKWIKVHKTGFKRWQHDA